MSRDAQSTAIYRELITLVKQVKALMDHPSHNRYKDESAMWYGIDKFGVVDEENMSCFLEVMRLVDGRTDDPALYDRV